MKIKLVYNSPFTRKHLVMAPSIGTPDLQNWYLVSKNWKLLKRQTFVHLKSTQYDCLSSPCF